MMENCKILNVNLIKYNIKCYAVQMGNTQLQRSIALQIGGCDDARGEVHL